MNRPSAYRAPWWLPGSHLQTIWPLARKGALPAYRRERWGTPDGDFIDLDWAPGGRDDAPLLVLFHGLEGSSRSHYARTLMRAASERGWRAVVQTGSEERRDALDQHLWTFRDDSFLAHATDREPHPAEQPVLLTTGQGNANAAQIRFLVDGAEPPDLAGYARAVFLCDGLDAAQVEAARGHWKRMKAAGHGVTYWQQTPDRRWERKA